jgi:phosphomannomutase/phosphoglucomutase
LGRLFGTNGIRGIVGKDMTPDLALGIGMAAGTHFGGTVAVGRDTRTSSEMLLDSLVSGLTATGIEVIDTGIVPTPCLQYYVKTSKLAGGVIITASHNPPEYNGIKCVDSLGMECSSEDEDHIEALYSERKFKLSGWDSLGIARHMDAIPRYIEDIVSRVDGTAISRHKPKVVLDCGNGAACFTAPDLLVRLGCELVTLNAQPDGHFPGRLPEPVPANIGELMKIVRDMKADIGIAHDGDADRVIFVDDKGEYIFGDKSLALMAGEILADRGGIVVTPVSSSTCLEEVVKSRHGEVHYTRVGSPIVARTMFEIGATFGGEENGGMIFPEHQFCRDGAMAAAKMLEILAHHREPLSALIAGLPQYQLFKTSVPHPPGLRDAIMEQVRRRTAGLEVNAVDGVKIIYDDGWVLIRPSGTESLFRVFAESRDKEKAESLAVEGAAMVREIIENLKTQASHKRSK